MPSPHTWSASHTTSKYQFIQNSAVNVPSCTMLLAYHPAFTSFHNRTLSFNVSNLKFLMSCCIPYWYLIPHCNASRPVFCFRITTFPSPTTRPTIFPKPQCFIADPQFLCPTIDILDFKLPSSNSLNFSILF